MLVFVPVDLIPLPAKQPRSPGRPQLGLVVPPVIVLRWLVDDVMTIRVMSQRHHPVHGLYRIRLRAAVKRVQLAGPGPGLVPGDILDSGERKQVSQLGRVQYVVGLDGLLSTGVQVEQGNGPNTVVVRVDSDRLSTQPDFEQPGGSWVGQHLLQYGQRNTWFVTQARDEPVPRIQIRVGACLLGERIVVAVVVSYQVTVPAVAAGAAKTLDPGVLVRRHSLGW